MTLSEYESKQILQKYRIPVTREVEVDNPTSFLAAIKEIGLPVVIKGCGAKLSHKTERSLVHVDVRSEADAIAAFEEIMEAVKAEDGAVLVQEMIKGKRELVVGFVRGSQFGPCVMFGLGGIFTEILKDIVFRVAPLTKKDALEMMQEIKGAKFLKLFAACRRLILMPWPAYSSTWATSAWNKTRLKRSISTPLY